MRRLSILPLFSLLLLLAGGVLVAFADLSVHAPERPAAYDAPVEEVAADEHTPPMEGMPADEDGTAASDAPAEMPGGGTDDPVDGAAMAVPPEEDHDTGLTPPAAEAPLPAATETPTPSASSGQAPAAGSGPVPTPVAVSAVSAPAATRVPTPAPVSATPAPAASAPLPKTVNIVLLGSDRRPTQTHWRTDTMIVVMLNPQTKQAGVISLHRDLWVNTPKGATKINTVDYGVGTAGMKQTLSALLGVPIDYYVRIEFDGVIKAIDTLGGITVNVDCPFTEYYQDPRVPGGVRTLKVPAGRVRFTGQMALDYSRSRLSTGVSDRMKRQMKVLLGVREKLLAPETFPRIPELWEQTKGLVKTDLPPALILPLVKLASELKLDDAHGLAVNERFGRVTTSPQKWWIVAPDVNAIRNAVRGIFNAPALTNSVKGAGC